MGFGRLGMPELILILAIALVIFGPSKLPEIGKSLGRAIKEFKDGTNPDKDKEVSEVNKEDNLKKRENDEKRD